VVVDEDVSAESLTDGEGSLVLEGDGRLPWVAALGGLVGLAWPRAAYDPAAMAAHAAATATVTARITTRRRRRLLADGASSSGVVAGIDPTIGSRTATAGGVARVCSSTWVEAASAAHALPVQ